MNPKISTLSDRQKQLVALFAVDGLRATFTPDDVIDDWPQVKKVFLTFGAAWKTGPRGGKGHFIFPDVAALQRFEEARRTGDYVEPRANDFFPTPDWLAKELVSKAGIQTGDQVLEPSAGKGAIASVIRHGVPGAALDCCELLPENRSYLQARDFTLVATDFLEFRLKKGARPYDAIVMNPPFGTDGGKGHVLHALELLRPGGSLVAIMSAGVSFREDRASVEFRALVERLGGTLSPNPDDTFTKSGTLCRTITVVMAKPHG